MARAWYGHGKAWVGRFEGGGPGIKLLSIELLGQPAASFEGQPVRFRLKKALALLCYLTAERRKHNRSELAELLWPRSDERHARTGLRSALAKLRKTLGEDGAHGDADEVEEAQEDRFFVVDGDLLGVEPGEIELDLRTLEAAVSLAQSETSETSPGRSRSADAVGRRDLIGRLEGALGVYRGKFMEGFSLEDAPEFEMWLEAERERWRGVFGELCLRLSSLQAEAGETRKAMDTVRLWTRHAPLEEAAYRRLVELLSATGDGAGALLAYEDFRNTLSRELGAEPSPQMQELAGRMREEVEERASLGASLTPFAATTSITNTTTAALSVVEVPLAGRQEEFGALVSEYHAAQEGQTRVVAVLGEGGIGKTRLAEEFLGWARARGADDLKGGASEGGAGLPYGPLVEAIRPRIERERAPDDLLEDFWLSEVSRLLPELKERYPDLPPPTSGDEDTAKGALFEAIARMVGALASRAPVVLFLDDLQWADAMTIEVLEYAGRRWAEQGAHLLVVIAARPEEPEASPGFEGWLSSLGRRLYVRSLTLGPLGSEEVEGLLWRLARAEPTPSAASWALEQPGDPSEAQSGLEREWERELERFVERLLAETGGQPFYLVETLKALLEEGKLVVRSRADGETVVEVGPAWREGSALNGLLPQSIREVIRSRLSRLSPVAFDLLRAGAVLGRGFGFESLVGVAGLGEDESLRGLDELVGHHLLREEAGGQEGGLLYPSAAYSFSHEKIRQVAYTEGGHARRRVLHRRAFEVLEESGAPAAQLARHALAAGLAEPSFRYSLAAGDDAVEVFAVRDAIVHYERARDLLVETRTRDRQLTEPSVTDLERLYPRLGRAYEMTYEWEKARAAYETALALAREVGEAVLEVVSLNYLASFLYHRERDPARARALLEEAMKVAEEAGLAEELVETECNLADAMALWAGEFERSRPLAEKALASARALERPDLAARALTALARQEMFTGRLKESSAYAKEGAALSRELDQLPAPPRAELPSILTAVMGVAASWEAGMKAMELQCLNYLAYGWSLQGRAREGVEIGREALGLSRGLSERARAQSSAMLSIGLVEAGEYEEALKLSRQGVELARKAENALLLSFILGQLGRAYEALLDLEEARKIYEEALELERSAGPPQYAAISSVRLCGVAALSGNWEDAYAHTRRAREVETSFTMVGSLYVHHEVEALLRGGDERGAREEARRFAERAETNERDRLAYLRSLAILSEWQGDTKTAIGHLHEAKALAEKLGLPGELWQTQSRIGEIHELHGEGGEAREAFSRATPTLRTLAEKIGDEKLRKGFLSAPQVRCVLGRH